MLSCLRSNSNQKMSKPILTYFKGFDGRGGLARRVLDVGKVPYEQGEIEFGGKRCKIFASSNCLDSVYYRLQTTMILPTIIDEYAPVY